MTVRERIRALWERWLSFRAGEEARFRAELGEGELDRQPDVEKACDSGPGAPSLEDLVAARQAEKHVASTSEGDSGRGVEES